MLSSTQQVLVHYSDALLMRNGLYLRQVHLLHYYYQIIYLMV